MASLDDVDLSLSLSEREGRERLEQAQRRLLALRLQCGGLNHFLWRFWSQLPGWGGMCVHDRSWYGRVLVERVEGFATCVEWQRAYGEIVDFERSLHAERAAGQEPVASGAAP